MPISTRSSRRGASRSRRRSNTLIITASKKFKPTPALASRPSGTQVEIEVRVIIAHATSPRLRARKCRVVPNRSARQWFVQHPAPAKLGGGNSGTQDGVALRTRSIASDIGFGTVPARKLSARSPKP